MSKCTPGPWKFGKELSAHSGEWLISYDAGDRGQGIAIAETRAATGSELANARLISAAPELLQELEGIIAFTDGFAMYHTDSPAGHGLRAWINGARAAIAKATGESP